MSPKRGHGLSPRREGCHVPFATKAKESRDSVRTERWLATCSQVTRHEEDCVEVQEGPLRGLTDPWHYPTLSQRGRNMAGKKAAKGAARKKSGATSKGLKDLGLRRARAGTVKGGQDVPPSPYRPPKKGW